MTTITKKIWPEWFEKVKSGEKKVEARLGDFDIKPGDTLILKEWNPKSETYTGREVKTKVSYVMNTSDLNFWSEEDVEKYGINIIQLDLEDQNNQT